MRVCYFGTYREEYSRNRIMIEGLRQAGVEVVECHQSLWQGIEDRVKAASGGWLKPAFWGRVIKTYLQLLKQYRQVGDYDVLVVGYPGQLDVFLGRWLSWLRRKPLVWDVFMSIYLIALERKLDQRSPLSVQLLRKLEWLACRLPDRLILDTDQYAAWFQATHGAASDHFRLTPTGADDRVFHPRAARPEQAQDDFFHVLYYGTFIANHGVPYIIKAAHRLQGEPNIRFELIGNGPEKAAAEELARTYALTNVNFGGWLEKEALVEAIARADLCLGAFGATPQSLMTVQNKIYEGMAMAKPVITGDSLAVRAAFTPGEEIILCDRNDPAALAEAIRQLQQDAARRARLAQQGYQCFARRYTIAKIGGTFADHLNELLRMRQP